MEKLTTDELRKIQERIACIYDDIFGRYDNTKYPEQDYENMVSVFSEKKRKMIR